MSSLAEVQQLFWRLCRGEKAPDELQATFRGGTGLSASEGIGVYRRMFVYRQIEALRHEFPRTNALLGINPFNEQAERYILQHPSEHPALEWLGRNLGEYLASHGPEPRSAVSGLAALEWARSRAFLAPNPARVLAATDIDPATFVSSVPRVVPSLSTASIPRIGVRLWDETPESGLEALQLEPEDRQRVRLVVWRQGFSVYHRSLAEPEAGAVDALLGGSSFAEICEAFADEQQAFAVLVKWFGWGWIESLEARK